MSTIKTGAELAAACLDVAKNYRTLYVLGCFGAPMTASNKPRYCNNYDYNQKAERTAMIMAASADTFGFDCVCMIKGLLWGWCGDTSKVYGGAGYQVNGVPDIGADQMIKVCSNISTDFSSIEVGEVVWLEGHIGVYIGDGLAVECTPKWNNCVQVTAVHNIGTKSGYNGRKWTKHGKLPYVTYTGEAEKKPSAGTTETAGTLSVGDIAEFSGTTHYSSANAANGVPCKAGRAKITAICAGAKHPYHCQAVNSSGEFISGVYGWVDAVTVKATTTPATPAPPVVLTGVASTGSDEDFVAFLDALLDMGLTLAGACGVLASIMNESAGKSDNLENRGNTELSMTDKEYTEAVDSGKYTNYAGDRCGYGLFQHTYPTRKAEMLAYFQALGKSISDWMTQIAFAVKEMKEGFPGVWAVVTTTNDPKEASDIFTKVFEAPANTEKAMKDRGELAQECFKKFSPAANDTPTQPSSAAGGVNLPTLRKGDKGDTVKAMQALLIGYGYSCGSSGVDGSFGGNTENALECYQEDNDLAADAVCGPKTWNSLLGL